MSDIAVTTQPVEVKPAVEETHVPHENGSTATAPQTQAAPVAPVDHSATQPQAATQASTLVTSDVAKQAPQNTEDVDLDIDVESKPELRKDQASEVCNLRYFVRTSNQFFFFFL